MATRPAEHRRNDYVFGADESLYRREIKLMYKITIFWNSQDEEAVLETFGKLIDDHRCLAFSIDNRSEPDGSIGPIKTEEVHTND